VTAPFLFLTVCSVKNRVRRRLMRLREPRYLLGLIAGLAYLYVFVVRNQMRSSRRTVFDLSMLGPHAADVVTGGALLLFVGLMLVWLWPFPAAPWTFTPAEVQFFFTAPVTRRQLLDYKLARSQLGVLFGVLLLAFFSGAMRTAPAGPWTMVVGGWLAFAILQLHGRGAALTKLALRAPISKVPALAWASVAVVVTVSGLLLGALAVDARRIAATSVVDGARAAFAAAKSPLAAAVLWPFAAVVRPVLALTPAAFAWALPPGLAVLLAHYWWVMSSDARFEDAALAAERRQSKRQGGGLPAPTALAVPFKLAVRGRVETAILWKNTILLGRYFSIALIVRVLIPMTVLAFVVGLQSRGAKVAPLTGVLAVFMTLMGPYMVRNDLRHDMPRLPVLKTWPVSGRQLVSGELLAPAVALTILSWFLIAVTVALLRSSDIGAVNAVSRLALAAGAAVVAPMLISGQLLIQNAAVVLFPGWIAAGSGRARGIEAMGQNMLMFAGTMLALVVGLLPAVAVAAGLGYVLYLGIGWLAAVPAAVVLASILAIEAWLVIGWLGRLIERTDPAAVEAVE
jgi:ABC-2 type transport system permease protein